MKIFINERIVDEKRAVIPVSDRGLLYGDGLFETMRSYKGKIFMLDKHLDRLYSSSEVIDLKIDKDRKYIKFVLYKLLKVNNLKDARVRLTITRGSGRVGLDCTSVKDQSLIITAKKFVPYPDRFYKKGTSLFISQVRRDERSKLSGIKSLNYLSNILARIEAQAEGADDAIMLNTKGHVAETAVSNIFMVRKKKLITPSVDSGILPGITREIVLSLAPECDLKSVERHITPEELKKSREVFITNTAMQIIPVTKIDDKQIGTGKPGLYTKHLHRLYQKLT